MRILYSVILACALLGCSGLLPALQAASAGSQWLGSILDVAKAGSDAYYSRHSLPVDQGRVDVALLAARKALAALDHVLATTKAIDAGDVRKARAEALAAYAELRSLLAELGVLSAESPAGGAEGLAPEPQPFELPTSVEVAARL